MSVDRLAPRGVRLADLPGPVRLATACFVAGLLAFYGLAQLKVITTVGGGTEIPGPEAILHRYNGDPMKTRLHQVLDPKRRETDPLRMYGWLGADDAERAANRGLVIGWIERGATEAAWPTVAPVFGKCQSCHSATAEGTGTRPDLPFERFDQVFPFTRGDDGMAFSDLATTSHNHLFGFLVGSLLVSTIFGLSRWRGPIVSILVVGAFAGALVDVGAWWATKAWGSPFHLVVFAGGAVFGICLVTMSVLALDELALRGVLGGLLERPLRALRLGRREVP
jgi:hypothetical protein